MSVCFVSGRGKMRLREMSICFVSGRGKMPQLQHKRYGRASAKQRKKQPVSVIKIMMSLKRYVKSLIRYYGRWILQSIKDFLPEEGPDKGINYTFNAPVKNLILSVGMCFIIDFMFFYVQARTHTHARVPSP